MKKFISLAIAAIIFSGVASAQNNLNSNGSGLAGILGKVAGAINGSGSAGSDTTSNTINDILTTITGIINNNTLTEDKIPGNWTYSGSAVSFKSENALSNVASTFAEGAVEKKLDSYLAKIGISEGKFGFVFNSDKTVSLIYGNRTYNGTWNYDADKAQIQIKIAKLINVKGYITVSNGTMKLLFNSNTMLKIIKALSAKSSNSNVKAIGTLLKSYNEMYTGFKLKK